MKISRTIISVFASAAALLPVASVGALVVTYTPQNGGLSWTQPFRIDSINEAGGVGGILAEASSSNPSGYTTDFVSVCLDVLGVLQLDTPQTFTPVGFPAATLLGLNPPWGNDGSGGSSGGDAPTALNNAAHLLYAAGSVLTSGSTADKVALQLAVWEVLYDTGLGTGFSLDNGRFQVPSNAEGAAGKAAAQSLLNTLFPSNIEVASASYTGELLVPVKLVGGEWVADSSKQELILNPGSITPVPEASTLFAGFAGLGMILAAWTRHSRRNTAATVG
jgi:hypothetical protein